MFSDSFIEGQSEVIQHNRYNEIAQLLYDVTN